MICESAVYIGGGVNHSRAQVLVAVYDEGVSTAGEYGESSGLKREKVCCFGASDFEYTVDLTMEGLSPLVNIVRDITRFWFPFRFNV